MAKAQGKKAATSARRGTTAKPAKKVPKPTSRATKKRVKPAAKRPAKQAAKAKPQKKKASIKPPAKPAKTLTLARKVAPAKTAVAVKPPRPADRVPKGKAAGKTVARAGTTPAVPATASARTPKPAEGEGKKRRRSRPRITSSGPATAAWFSQGEKPRPSSFIPAPPRAEAPSLVAAPPASSDRLVSSNELTEFAVRTVPVRIDVEAGGGRIFLSIYPTEVELRVGEGIEWDFRYLGGADVVIDELIIEFDKPSPFTGSTFRSRRPGAARPHRQLSGRAHKTQAGKRVRYTIRAMNAFKSEMATAQPWVNVVV